MTRAIKQFPNDTSGDLFDYLRKKFKLGTDKELSDKIDVLPHTVSRVRNGKQELTSQARYRISVNTGLSPKAIEKLIGGE